MAQRGDEADVRLAGARKVENRQVLLIAEGAKVVFSRQEQDGFSFDVEDLVIAKKLGLRAVEVPVRWSNAEGTKVTMAQGLRSFTDLLRIRKDHK